MIYDKNNKNIKEVWAQLLYNGYNVTKDFSPYVEEISYTDFEKEESDEINIRLIDPNFLFINDWCPQKGDKILCKIGFKNVEDYLDCGTFTVDENEIEISTSGTFVTLKALAATISKPVRSINTRYFEGKTLLEIAEEIAQKHGFKIAGDIDRVNVGRVNQIQETDLFFLRRIAERFGYVFKLTDNLLTFTKVESLTNSETLFTIRKEDINTLNIKNMSTKTYKSCCAKYYNPKKKKLCSYTKTRENSLSSDTLKLSTVYHSIESARLAANSALAKGSKSISGNITLKEANFNFIAGVNFNLVGCGSFDGKYHVKSSTHTVNNNGYTVSGEIEKC